MTEGINPQMPFAECEFEDSPEHGMILTVNGTRYLMSPRSAVELNEKLTMAVARWFKSFWKG